MTLGLGLRALALGVVHGLFIRWLRRIKYEKAPRRLPTTWGDWAGAVLSGIGLGGLWVLHPLAAALGIAAATALVFLLWLDAVLYRVFTFELGAGGVGGVVLSNLYREVVKLSTARAFFRAERRFTLLPAAALVAQLGLLAPGGSLLPLLVGGLLAGYLWPTRRLRAAGSGSGGGGRALIHDFLRPRRPHIPTGFRPRPEHAALLARQPTVPPPSPEHGLLRGASVVLLTFESLGATHLCPAAADADAPDRARTPFLDSLRRAGVSSQHHLCPAPLTNSAHIALYASRPVAPPGPWSLAALGAAGYRTVYLTAATAGHYGLARILHSAGFQHIIDGPALQTERGPIFDQVLLSAGLRALRERLGSGPYFLHIHAANTHIPYRVADPQRFGRHDAQSDRGRFLNGVEETDALFGELWAALLRLGQERGETQEPLLLISSDHGQSFGEKDYFSHGSAVSDEQLSVPLLLHHPRLLPRRVRSSTHYDVLPTVLDLLGVQPAPPSLGVSLFHPDRAAGHLLWDGQPSRRTSNCLGLLDGERKYTLDLLRDTCIESDRDDRNPRALPDEERRYVEALLGTLAQNQGIQ